MVNLKVTLNNIYDFSVTADIAGVICCKQKADTKEQVKVILHKMNDALQNKYTINIENPIYF